GGRRRPARRGGVLAAHGAPGRFRSTRVPRDASEPRNARATAPCVVAGGVPLLRGGDAGARRAAARSRVGGDAPTRSLLKRGVSGARARAEFFTCNRRRGIVQGALSYQHIAFLPMWMEGGQARSLPAPGGRG